MLSWGLLPNWVVSLIFALLAWAYIWHQGVQKEALESRVSSLVEESRIVKRSHAATVDATEKRAADQVRIVTVTKELIREIPKLIPAGSPALPAGFSVLHDSAAHGVLPDPAGPADAAPVDLEVAAETVADNYGSCLDNTSKLERLQQWILNNSVPPQISSQ